MTNLFTEQELEDDAALDRELAELQEDEAYEDACDIETARIMRLYDTVDPEVWQHLAKGM